MNDKEHQKKETWCPVASTKETVKWTLSLSCNGLSFPGRYLKLSLRQPALGRENSSPWGGDGNGLS